jgi:hypothetical protein
MALNELDRTIHEYALLHLEQRQAELTSLIERVHQQLGVLARKRKIVAPDSSGPDWVLSKAKAKAERQTPNKRIISADGKAKIAAAQKKRWAAVHEAAKTVKTSKAPKTAKAVKVVKVVKTPKRAAEVTPA